MQAIGCHEQILSQARELLPPTPELGCWHQSNSKQYTGGLMI